MGSKSRHETGTRRKFVTAVLVGLFVGLGVSIFSVAWRAKKADLKSQTDSLHATFSMQLSQKVCSTSVHLCYGLFNCQDTQCRHCEFRHALVVVKGLLFVASYLLDDLDMGCRNPCWLKNKGRGKLQRLQGHWLNKRKRNRR